MQLKKIAAGAAMVGALGFGAVGLGAGIASAAPDSGDWAQWSHDGSGRDDRASGDNRGGSNYPPAWGCITGTITWCPM
jgi:hypothetical protein